MTTPLVKYRADVQQIVAGDGCFLQEMLHPAHDAADLPYSLAYAYVEVGGRTLDHTLEQSEVYYVIAGTGTMYLDGKPHQVQTGATYYIPEGCSQWLQNDGETRFEFICIVAPPWTEEGETVLEEDDDA